MIVVCRAGADGLIEKDGELDHNGGDRRENG